MLDCLLIDDEPPALRQLERLLVAHADQLRVVGRYRRGADVLAAVDAFVAAGQALPAVAFIDMQMPGMTGLEIAAMLHARLPGLAAVFVTAHRDYAADAFAEDAVDFLLKPVTPPRLAQAVVRLQRHFAGCPVPVAATGCISASHHVLLIDDHAIFRRGLRMLLREANPESLVTEAESVEQALALDIPPPGLALLDIKLPGMSGLEGIAFLKRRWPAITVVILSALDAPEVFSYGAAGYISKREHAENLLDRIDEAMGRSPLSAALTAPQNGHLTPRQREVLDLVCQGLSNKLIARQLSLSENTVRRHVQDILEYFQVASRTEAVNVARRRGLAE